MSKLKLTLPYGSLMIVPTLGHHSIARKSRRSSTFKDLSLIGLASAGMQIFVMERGEWDCLSFHGTRWQRVNAEEPRLHLKNAYRVILTRAREGMIVFVPEGSGDDPTRAPAYYDQTYEFLKRCGLLD